MQDPGSSDKLYIAIIVLFYSLWTILTVALLIKTVTFFVFLTLLTLFILGFKLHGLPDWLHVTIAVFLLLIIMGTVLMGALLTNMAIFYITIHLLILMIRWCRLHISRDKLCWPTVFLPNPVWANLAVVLIKNAVAFSILITFPHSSSFFRQLLNCWFVLFLHWIWHILIIWICIGCYPILKKGNTRYNCYVSVPFQLLPLFCTPGHGRRLQAGLIRFFWCMHLKWTHLGFIYLLIHWKTEIHNELHRLTPKNIKVLMIICINKWTIVITCYAHNCSCNYAVGCSCHWYKRRTCVVK